MSEMTGGGTVGVGEDLASELSAHAARFESVCPPQAGPPGAAGATRLFFAPGRVNLMGAHLDYSGGPVMPMAIDRGTFLAVRPRADRRIHLRSTLEDVELDLDLDQPLPERSGNWFDYPLGILRLLEPSARRTGMDVLYGGNLPIAAGLSSSASICIATALAFDRVWELGLGPERHVELALAAERGFVGVQCGIMDPYAIGLARPGQMLWLDCKDRTTAHLPLDPTRVRVAVADTGVRRALAQGEFNRRVAETARAFELLGRHVPGAECLRDVPLEVLESHGHELEPNVRRRARHVVEEVQRTFEARAALERGDLAGFGQRMLAAHHSLRDLYEVSVEELDVLVEAAEREPEVFGGRLTGAGFGGCVAMLLAPGADESTLERIGDAFEERFGRRPEIAVFGGDPGPREIELTDSPAGS